MRIRTIALHNFGSYVGHNIFDFDTESVEERVVVIGGKNGAGKTTLFTAVQVCLYGNYAFGFKTAGKKYLSEIYNLINSQVRIDEHESAYLEISFQQIDNTDLFDYVIRRTWTWAQNEILESLCVWQNGIKLEEDELLNFQNYLIHLIPPDMLKLYFFDGEKIADYFLSSKEVNIRDALMVLSGNDTFDILYEQVKRVLKSSEKSGGSVSQDYLDAQMEIEKIRQSVFSLQLEIDSIQESIDELEADIDRHKKEYATHGGITLDDWTSLHSQLKTEEEKRERLNWQRKAYATDTLPFVIVSDLVKRVLPQLQAETEHKTYLALKERLDGDLFASVLAAAVQSIGSSNVARDSVVLYEKITEYLLDNSWETFIPLFGLSSDEELQVQAVINRINGFEPATFAKYQKRINASLERSKEIRAKLQSSSIEHFEHYVQALSAMEEELKVAQLKKEHTQEILAIRLVELEQKELKLKTLKKAFEDMLKAQSVSTVSGKALLLLEELQSVLYANLIRQVESDLNEKFRELIRKADFFSRICIDENFNVHILREEEISTSDILALLRGNNYSLANNVLGRHAVNYLQDYYNIISAADLRKALTADSSAKHILPIEINKDRLSSGEKQIFVMSLYWAMMNQSKNELPFIIDTPFARIDAQHRANITEHFFKKLSGQLIILSTDEEISSHHLEAMAGQISHVYMIEYGLDKRTHIQENRYFEV